MGRRVAAYLAMVGASIATVVGAARVTSGTDSPSVRFEYRVQASSGLARVHVRISGLPLDPQLGFAADERHLGIRNLSFAGAQGPLAHHTTIECVDPGRKLTRKWHRIPGSHRVLNATFEIDPPAEFRKNGDGRRYGVAGPTTVLAGGHLILLPRSGGCGSGRVHFPDRSILGRPWTYTGDVEMRELLDRRFAIGPELAARLGEWRLYLDPAFDPETRDRFTAEFDGLFQEVRRRVGWWTDLPWDLVVAPRAPDTVRVAHMSAPDFVFLDADRPYPRFWGEALHAWTDARTGSGWFELGLAGLIGSKVARRLAPELPDPTEEISRAASSEPAGFDVGLSGPLPPDQDPEASSLLRSCKALLILELIHEALVKAGRPEGVWEAARGHRGGGDPFESLTRIGGREFTNRIRTWTGPSGFPYRKMADFRFDPSPSDPGAGALTLCFTGSGKGELESCGCATGMAGGLARRATILKSLSGPVVSIDLGNSLSLRDGRRLSEDDEAEQRKYIELLEKIGTDVQVPGTAELARGREFFQRVSHGRNLAFTSDAAAGNFLPRSASVRRGDLRIAVVGFSESCMDPLKYRTFGDAPDPVPLSPDLGRLERSLDLVRDADLVIVAGWIAPNLLRRMLDRLGDRIDVILNDNSAARGGLPVLKRRIPGGFSGRTLVLFHEQEGKGLTLARLRLSGRHQVAAFECRSIALDDSVPEDPDVRRAVSEFYEESARRELSAAGGVRPLIDWDPAFHGRFVGTDRCVSCHADQAQQHRVTKHALAFNTLIRAGRQMTTRCTPCHVVGFALPTGWNPVSPADRLRHIGCESCHGAGGDHADHPGHGNIRRTPLKETCLSCHDPKHSPDFEATFQRRWNSVRH